jgi:chromosomal replication initiation ATPase DnaA
MRAEGGEIELAKRRGERSEWEGGCRFIEALVASALGVSLSEMGGASRGRAPVATARQTAMYLAHVSLGMSLARIGACFRRDRTTVAHACRRIEDRREDATFGRILDCLEAAIDRWQEEFLAGGRGR